MKLYCLTGISIGLGAAATCLAEDSQVAGLTRDAAAAEGPELVFSDYRPAESTLLPQINAVLAALIAEKSGAPGAGGGVGPAIETVDVNSLDAAQVEARAAAVDTGLCVHMAQPGSRIMRERCFYETPAEADFNDYRFQQEIEQMREQNARDFLEVSEFGLQYRRSLAEQE